VPLPAITIELRCARRATVALDGLLLVAAVDPAIAAGCAFTPQGEGRVTEIVDARTFRLEDGRDVILAGIEPVTTDDASTNAEINVKTTAKTNRTAALSAIVAGHEVTLRSDDDTPDRYGRQPAFVFLGSSDKPEQVSVQVALLAQGAALVAATVTDKDYAATLATAEAAARTAKRGIWADPAAIKNTESPGDILAGTGRFMLVEGKVLSVRQAGATTYLNFGRNWTRDFAVTIPKRMIAVFEAAGIVLKSLENRRIRVRGWVEARGGPRIEALRVGQIGLLGEN
jgi:endonuclease YncB( thermonuclease family)